MEITANIVHQLREDTSSGLSTCQSALKLTNGNYEEAVKFCKMGETRYLFCTVIKLTE